MSMKQMMATTLVATLAACALPAIAQDSEVGARPPVMNIRDVIRQQAEQAGATRDLVEAEASDSDIGGSTPVDPQAAVAKERPATAEPVSPEQSDVPVEQAAPAKVASTRSTRTKPKGVIESALDSRSSVKPAPAVLNVESGRNVVIGVAFSLINRIITPFSNPVVKTTSVATTSVEGSIVYISTNMSEPIALFIHEKSDPSTALSLTLVPAEIPPVSTEVRITGLEVEPAKIAGDHALATAFEQQDTFLGTIKALFRDLALNRVPDGYGFKSLDGYARDMPVCNFAGVHVIPLQEVVGASLKAYVAKATNTSQYLATIDEQACSGPGLRAVAAWPHTTLAPGESVELYVALDASVLAPDSDAVRPSVIGGMR